MDERLASEKLLGWGRITTRRPLVAWACKLPNCQAAARVPGTPAIGGPQAKTAPPMTTSQSLATVPTGHSRLAPLATPVHHNEAQGAGATSRRANSAHLIRIRR